MKKLYIITLLSLFAISCSKDSSEKPAETPPTNVVSGPVIIEKNYKIIVVDEANLPVANATITDGTTTITCGTDGKATFNKPKETYGKFRFDIKKVNYFDGSLNLINVANPDEDNKVILLNKPAEQPVASTGGVLTGIGWTFTSTGGFKDKNNIAVTGNVDVSIKYIKPADLEASAKAFPGQDFTSPSGGANSIFFVYGWIAINYTRNGIRVYPAAGSVTIKVQVPGVYANAAQNGGKVFYFDEASNIWEESANPTVSGLDVTMPLPSEATFCALGKKEPTTTILYTKNTCNLNDGFGYATQITFDGSNYCDYTNSIAGVNYSCFTYNSGSIDGAPPFLYGSSSSDTEGNYFPPKIYDNTGFENQSFTFLSGYTGGFKVHSLKITCAQGQLSYIPVSDKVIKTYASFPPGVTNLGLLNTVCDGTNPNPHNTDPIPNPTLGSGQFTFDGQTISGFCGSTPAQTQNCTGIDVLITNTQVANQTFVIRNMPTASTGTFNVGSFNNCNPRAECLVGGTAASTAGTITKTGAKSFTFSITMNAFATRGIATGSGSYP